MDKSINEQLKEIKNLLLSSKTVLNFNELAAYTGLSKSYLYKLTCSGGVPCYKPKGKLVYFDKAEIDHWLLQNRKATTGELVTEANTYVALNKGQKAVDNLARK